MVKLHLHDGSMEVVNQVGLNFSWYQLRYTSSPRLRMQNGFQIENAKWFPRDCKLLTSRSPFLSQIKASKNKIP